MSSERASEAALTDYRYVPHQSRLDPEDYADELLNQEPLNSVAHLPAEEPKPQPNQNQILLLQ